MTDRSGSVPLSRPQSEMLAHVEALLGRHPKLLSLLERGWTLELSCDDDAIWVAAAAADGGAPATARLETRDAGADSLPVERNEARPDRGDPPA